MPRLIITADDLGANPQRSHGIFQCIEFGVVTCASLLANGSDSDDAGRRARERGVSAGLHLSLTEEYPLSKAEDIRTLVDAAGKFHGASHLRTLLDEDAVEQVHLEREIRAQVDWMFDVYGPPTHVNGHERIHLHPAIIEALCPVMTRYGIRFTRIPSEQPLPPYGYEISEAELAAARAVGQEAERARERYATHDIAGTEHFRGLTLHGNASLKNLRHILSRLPEDGVTELMTHPGSPTAYGTPFDLDPQRQTEMRMLLDETIPELLTQKRIELCSFGDL